MAIIITYDVPLKHTELKKALLTHGYKDQVAGIQCKTIYFPNTTLYHATKSSKEAVNDVQAFCKSLGIKLERCESTVWDSWYTICGEPFK